MLGHEHRPIAKMSLFSQDTHHRQGPAAAAAPRQQLPSLSSILGPPSSVSRPLASPSGDHQLPYPLSSPLDRTRGPSGPQTSYFSQGPSPISQRPSSRHDNYSTEGRSLPSLPRPVPSHPNANAPRYPETEKSLAEVRPLPNNNPIWWQETCSKEVLPGPREPYFRSPHHRLDNPIYMTSQHAQPVYPDPRAGTQPHQQQPQQSQQPPQPQHQAALPVPITPVAAEKTAVKDGLGPKIWTGTHFLPRFVRTGEVPGEGECYFYDDGTHCKTHIDGEAVNAHWGVTKAGKPRKRLAIACVTCREKKIKCDPDFPRCVQCEKFGRVCKFKNAPRGGNVGSPGLTSLELDDSKISSFQVSETDGSSLSPPTPSKDGLPEVLSLKRKKTTHDIYREEAEPPLEVPALEHSKLATRPRSPSDVQTCTEQVLTSASLTDPCVTDFNSTTALVAKFFQHADAYLLINMLPNGLFQEWLTNSVERKSSTDLMLVYAVLALGAWFSGDAKELAHKHASAANHAQKYATTHSLQLVQTRTLLALYYTMLGRTFESSELLAAAAGTYSALQLNVELEKSNERRMSTFPMGMSKAGYSEARRRTAWCLFTMERLSGLFPKRSAFLNADDFCIRVPTSSKTFDNQVVSKAPLFDSFELPISHSKDESHDVVSYLPEMVHLWASSQAVISQGNRGPSRLKAAIAQAVDLGDKIEAWRNELPAELRFNWENMELAEGKGNFGSFLAAHILYHDATIKLHRFRQQTPNIAMENLVVLLHKACDHTKMVFELITCVERAVGVKPSLMAQVPGIFGPANLEAVDMLLAQGPVDRCTEMIESVTMTKKLITNMMSYWRGLDDVADMLCKHLDRLYSMRETGVRPASPIQGYALTGEDFDAEEEKEVSLKLTDSSAETYPKEMDVVVIRSGDAL